VVEPQSKKQGKKTFAVVKRLDILVRNNLRHSSFMSRNSQGTFHDVTSKNISIPTNKHHTPARFCHFELQSTSSIPKFCLPNLRSANPPPTATADHPGFKANLRQNHASRTFWGVNSKSPIWPTGTVFTVGLHVAKPHFQAFFDLLGDS
jgi:hypothetical protein